jgi:hypothetical protein
MSGFLDRAKEQAQSALNQGREKVEEVQAQRAGNDLLRKVGRAYYAEQRQSGSAADVQEAMVALERHIAEHGDAFLQAGGGTAH